MKSRHKTKKAYTLIEVLLYVALTASLMFALVSLVTFLLQNRVKSQTVNDVEAQGVLMMQEITEIIGNARGITAPASAVSASSLTLDSYDVNSSPIVIFQNGSQLQITEGSKSPVTLSGSKMLVSQLSFTNAAQTGTAGSIKIVFTLSYSNPGNQNEYSYQQTFYGSATIKK